MPLVRGDAVVSAPLMGILELLLADANAGYFDRNLLKMKMLEVLDDQTAIVYQGMSGTGPVSGRDFCVVRHHRLLPNGGALVINSSVQHPQCEAHQVKGLVRATTPYNGWVARARAAEKDVFDVTWVGNINPQIKLPKFIMNQVLLQSAGRVGLLQKLAAKSSFASNDELRERLLQTVFLALKQLEEDAAEGGWEDVTTNHDIKITRKPGSALIKVKGESVLDAQPAEIRRVLCDVPLTTKWDPMCKKASVIAEIDENTHVANRHYQARRCFLPVSRDLCVCTTCHAKSDGSFLVASASVEHPRCPPRQDMVRARLMPSGWIVRPVQGGRKSSVTYVVSIDLCGGVPPQVVDYAVKRMPLVIEALGKWIESKPA